MVKFKSLKPISMKDALDIDEASIQDYIAEHPEELQLGKLVCRQREKIQSSGGRVDMILDDECGKWYEVEIQLGATDPSHIIRTIEYWDNERWKYPQFEHYAVIIAEELTGRFFNVISLFNKHIPIIAIQMSAFRDENGETTLVFSKVLGKEEREVEGMSEVYDRKFWVDKLNEERVKTTTDIFYDLLDENDGYRMKYNKYYIGVLKDGIVKNFVEFEPQKQMIVLRIKLSQTSEIDELLKSNNINFKYDNQWDRYYVKVNDFEKYKQHKGIIEPLIQQAKERMGVE